MTEEQRKTFWEIIEIFDKTELLPYVMVIGSWAEYLYQNYHIPEFKQGLKSSDVDIFYYNIRKPVGREIMISKAMEEKGFIYTENRLSGVGKYIKEGILEVEFLTRALAQGDVVNKIPSLKISASGIKEINILEKFPLKLKCKDFIITVPEPEAYVLQKILINPKRKTEEKREKDMMSIQELWKLIDKDRVNEVFKYFTRKQQNIIIEVCTKYTLDVSFNKQKV